MLSFKDYIAKLIVGKTLHFKGNCMLHLDVTGKIIEYSIKNNEIIYRVLMGNGRTISVGENHPSLEIEEVKNS